MQALGNQVVEGRMTSAMDIYNTRYFEINKKLLSTFGLWPYDNPVKKFFVRMFLVSFIFISSLPQLYGLRKNFGVHMDKIIEHIALLLYIYGIKLKLVTSILAEKKLKLVYENLAENWESLKDEDERRILMTYSEKGRMLTIGYITYMIMALLFFITLPITPIILNFIMPLNQSRPCDFILHGEFPMDPNLYYGQIYLFDSLACIVTVFIFCTVDSIYAACIEHCLGLFAIVKARLEASTKYSHRKGSSDAKQDDITYDFMVRTIKLHKKIIHFTNILESSYSTSFLILMGMNMLYCSFVSVLLIIRRNEIMERIRYSTILLGLLIHLFYISWPGQKLIDYSVGLFEDAYANEWYECSIRSQNLLKFMTLRCLTPCQLTAGGIYVMNFANFASAPSFDGLTWIYLLFYRAIAILPLKNREFDFLLSRVLVVFFLVSTTMHCSMFIGYGVNHAKQGTVDLDYICETVPLIGLATKHVMLVLRRDECSHLVTECRAIWDCCTSTERLTVQSYERRLRKLFKGLLVTCVLLNVFYSATAIAIRLPPTEPNGTERRMLPYRWYVDEVATSPAYELIFMLQVLLLNNAGIITMAIETAAPFLIMMTCGYFRVLQHRLDHMGQEAQSWTDLQAYSEIVACCKFHQSILRYGMQNKNLHFLLLLRFFFCLSLCVKIQKLTRTLFLVQLLCTAYNLSLVGIKLVGTDPDRYKFVSTFILCLVQLFICQWTPDYLLEESEGVSIAAYTASPSMPSPWTGRLLLMIMRRAQRPVEITAAGIVRLSLETFGSMITSAVSFFAVLRSFNA